MGWVILIALLVGCAMPQPAHHWSVWRLNLYRADRQECLYEALSNGGGLRAEEDKLEMRCMKRRGWWLGLKYCERFGDPTEAAPGICR